MQHLFTTAFMCKVIQCTENYCKLAAGWHAGINESNVRSWCHNKNQTQNAQKQ